MGFFTRSDGDSARPTSVPYRNRNAAGITASAVQINLTRKNEIEAMQSRHSVDKWQGEAWEYYDLIPEIKYAANLIANVASRVRIYAGYVTDDDTAPADIQDVDSVPDELKSRARETLKLLESGNGGLSGVLRDAALNLFVAGECYLVKEPSGPGSSFFGDTWQIRSTEEIVVSSGTKGGVSIKGRRNASEKELIKLPSTAYFGRIWRTHPRFSDEADSSMRGLLELCDQLLLYSRQARGVAKSRLNNGLLFVPDELSNVSQGDGELASYEPDIEGVEPVIAPLSDDESDSFEEDLMDSMTQPIADETAASSVVPLIVRGPADIADKIKHIKFERTFDPAIAKDSERTLERILAGLDIPKDVVAGMASVKYSNAITIEEQLYKAHIEPMILMIVDALTVVLMRPVLKSIGFTDDQISRVVVWYDPSAITTKPDKASSATIGLEKGAISKRAWRRATGFSESDKPTELEIAQDMAVEKGLISEPIMEALLYTLIPDILKRVRDEQQGLTDPAAREAVERAVNGKPQAEEVNTEDPTEGEEEPPSQLLEP